MTDPRRQSEVIHEAVAARAAEQPAAAALVGDGFTISYQVLEAASERCAAQLRERGTRPGQIVPLVLPRSPQLVAWQLAALKCGAAYVNLDRAWPAARQHAIMKQIQPSFVVARDIVSLPGGVGLLSPGEGDLTGAAGACPPTLASPPVKGDDLATVFFTSGTTGNPKGILIPHKAVTRLFQADVLPGFGPGHVTPQSAALPWDMYAFEMWGQLTAGGTVVLPKSDHLMPSGLRQLIDHNGADTVFLTTTLFNLFVDEDPACFTGVRTLYIGGEKLSSAHVRTFLKYQPTVAISNCYGPAENCMLTTTRLIEPSDCDIPEGIPIGVAVPRSAVVVIGESGRPCEPGELGEVCASGDGLAIGYLGQPGLTAEKFPTVTIDGVPTRIYRTGDFGFLDKLGVLQFRGRYDRQVKVSGYRIELGEIETAARQLAGVRECVALPMNDSEGRVTGIALCYLPEHGEAADTGSTSPPDYSESGIRRALRQVLPAHIMPASVRKFDRFPMTANGKVDATALDLAAKAAR